MLQIIVPALEKWDEELNEFVYEKEQTLMLEHSLVSVSKWESKWHKSFLSNTEKTQEEDSDYVRCMTIGKNVDQSVYRRLSNANLKQISEYIDDPMTATTFREDKKVKTGRDIITAEIIYHKMIINNIPSEYQKWHLNRLLTLIRVCDIKNAPANKRSKKDIMAENARLNEARKQYLNTRG